MPSCSECGNNVSRSAGDSITCGKCKHFFHLACVNININKAEYEKLKKCPKEFVCNNCKKDAGGDTCRNTNALLVAEKSALVTSNGDSIANNELINAIMVAVEQGQRVIMSEFKDEVTGIVKNLETKQDKFMSELCSTVASMKDDIVDNTRRIGLLEVESASQSKTLDHVQTENSKLQAKINQLERNLNIEEQSALSNCLEIHGLPTTADEDLHQIICKIAQSLNVNIEKDDIVNIYRIHKQSNASPHSSSLILFVKFSRQELRNKFIDQRKKDKNYSTTNIGLSASEKSIIYIREALTPLNRKIYATALASRRGNKIKYLWVSKGKIFCRRDDGECRIILSSLEDVNLLN